MRHGYQKKATDGKVKRETKFWVDKAVIGKEPALGSEVESEKSDAP